MKDGENCIYFWTGAVYSRIAQERDNPSVQIQLSHMTHLDISPLFGLTETSPEMKLYVIFGIDLSPGGEGGWYDPVSSRSR